MRLVIAIISALFVLGMTWLYQQTLAENQRPAERSTVERIGERYRLRITATFAAGVDPFAENVANAASLTVSYEGKSIFTVDQPIAAGEAVEADLDLELRPGSNEFVVEMSPANASEAVPKAVHVELYRRGFDQPIETRTIWAGPNESLVLGRVPFDVPKAAVSE